MIIKKFSKYLSYVVIFVVCILILRSFFFKGVPLTHDGESHLARLANFYIAVKDGHIPPRWAANLNYKFGYPAFNFYYPLPYIIALPFYLVFGSFEIAYKISVFLALLIAGIFMYKLLLRWLRESSALAGSILYIASPPFILQIFVRGAYGEIFAWALFPVCFYFLHSVLDNLKHNQLKSYNFAGLVGSLALLVLAHNMLFLFISSFLLAYCLFYLLRSDDCRKYLNTLIAFILIVLGVLISAYFLLPMIYENKFTNATDVAQSHYYYRHFIIFLQLINSEWGYGNSVEGLADGMSFQLGIVPIVLLILGFLHTVKKTMLARAKILKSKNLTLIVFLILCLLISIYLMLEQSLWIWQLIKPLKLVQYPWRLLIISSFSLSILTAFAWQEIKNKKVRILILAGVIINILTFARPQSILHKSKFEYLEFPFTTSVNHELLTSQFNMYENMDYEEKLKDLTGNAQFEIIKWKTHQHEYIVKTKQDTVIIEHLMYFPGWESYIDAQKINAHYQLQDYPGVYAYAVSKGEHRVISRFENLTYARMIGSYISIIALITTVTVYIFIRRNKNGK